MNFAFEAILLGLFQDLKLTVQLVKACPLETYYDLEVINMQNWRLTNEIEVHAQAIKRYPLEYQEIVNLKFVTLLVVILK